MVPVSTNLTCPNNIVESHWRIWLSVSFYFRVIQIFHFVLVLIFFVCFSWLWPWFWFLVIHFFAESKSPVLSWVLAVRILHPVFFCFLATFFGDDACFPTFVLFWFLFRCSFLVIRWISAVFCLLFLFVGFFPSVGLLVGVIMVVLLAASWISCWYLFVCFPLSLVWGCFLWHWPAYVFCVALPGLRNRGWSFMTRRFSSHVGFLKAFNGLRSQSITIKVHVQVLIGNSTMWPIELCHLQRLSGYENWNIQRDRCGSQQPSRASRINACQTGKIWIRGK